MKLILLSHFYPHQQKALLIVLNTCCKTVAHVLEAFCEKSCFEPFWTFWEPFVNHFERFMSDL